MFDETATLACIVNCSNFFVLRSCCTVHATTVTTSDCLVLDARVTPPHLPLLATFTQSQASCRAAPRCLVGAWANLKPVRTPIAIRAAAPMPQSKRLANRPRGSSVPVPTIRGKVQAIVGMGERSDLANIGVAQVREAATKPAPRVHKGVALLRRCGESEAAMSWAPLLAARKKRGIARSQTSRGQARG